MKVTIVGGGFAGVKVALELLKDKRNEITLITDRPDFQYYPALYNTATGHSHDQSWIPLGQIFAGKQNIEIIIDTITHIDREAKTLTTEAGVVFPYEQAILALGTVTTYFGIEGLDKYAYGMKSIAEIQNLKEHLHHEVQHEHALDNHYIIIGAGPTGIELSSTLRPYLERLRRKYHLKPQNIEIDLVEAMPRVMPKMSEKASKKIAARLTKLGVNVKTGMKVEKQDADYLTISGEMVESHTVVWTSGVANHPFFKANEAAFQFAPNGRIIVNEYAQVDKTLWVIGDNAATQFTGLAQTALYDAEFVAGNIKRQQDNRGLKRYKAVMPPVVVPVGDGWAVVAWKKILITGWVGGLIRRAADLIGYHDLLPLGYAMRLWREEKKLEDDYFPTPQ